jgi:hypothetical protein
MADRSVEAPGDRADHHPATVAAEVSPEDLLRLCDLRYRYAAGIDTRDWSLHRSIFTDEIEVDFSSYSGRPPARLSADDWVRGLQPLFTGLAASQHTMTNPRAVVTGDVATLQMYVQAEHVLDHDEPDSWFTLGGRYDDRMVRTEAGWRIESVTLTILWRRGRADIMDLAIERGKAALGAPPGG